MESHPIVRPGSDFLSRGSMAAPTPRSVDDGGPGPCVLRGKSGEKPGGGEESEGVLDQDGNLTAATLSNSSGSAVAIIAGGDVIPPSPTESCNDPAGWPLVPPSPAATATAAAAAAAGAAAAAASGLGSGMETEALSETTDALAAAAGRDDGVLVGEEGGEGAGADRERGKGGVRDGGIGVGGGGDGSATNGELGEGGGEADEEDGMVQRLFPPSFSSTNLVREKYCVHRREAALVVVDFPHQVWLVFPLRRHVYPCCGRRRDSTEGAARTTFYDAVFRFDNIFVASLKT